MPWTFGQKMKISRRGHYKNKGSALLLDREITVNHSGHRWKSPRWDEEENGVWLRLKGIEDDTTYSYEILFSADDLTALVETALLDSADSRGDRATAVSTVAYLREMLSSSRISKPEEE